MIFKTTEQILLEPWQTDAVNLVLPGIKFEVTPPQSEWNPKDNIKISDVKLWERIYYKGAHVGVYAAWDPDVEFYLVTYNLFLHKPQGMKTFFGPGAKRQVWKLAKELKVTLPINKIWVDDSKLDNELDLL